MNKFSDKTSGLLNFMELKKRRYRLLYWTMFAVLVIISLICVLPAIWVLLSGFKDAQEFYRIPPALFPEHFKLSKLSEVWQQLNFLKLYKNSCIIIIGDLIFNIILNGVMGYVLSRLKPKGTALVGTLIFWSMLLPTSMNLVPLFMGFVDVPIFHINMTDTYWPMWIMSGANAFNVLLFRNFFNGIPMSYIEAARIDGCTDTGIFARIVMPLAKPIIMVVAIFTVQAAWGNFLWPYLIIQDANKLPIAVKIYQFKSSGITIDKYMIALMFTIIPPAILFTIFSKHIMGGLNMSGLKG